VEYINEFPLPGTATYTFDADPDAVFLGNEKLPPGPFRFKPGRTAVKELRNLFGGHVRFILSIRDPVDWVQSLAGEGEDQGEYKNGSVMWYMMCLADSSDTWLEFFPNEQSFFFGRK